MKTRANYGDKGGGTILEGKTGVMAIASQVCCQFEAADTDVENR